MKSALAIAVLLAMSIYLGLNALPSGLADKYSLSTEGWPKPLTERHLPWQNSNKKIVATYFTEWSVFGRQYSVQDIPAQNLTHIIYAFIGICGPNEGLKEFLESSWSILERQCEGKEDYTVTIHDPYAATEKPFQGDSKEQALKGNYAQLIRLKEVYPDLKILPSIGGWTLSDPLFAIAPDPELRKRFIDSVEVFLRQWEFFDGVDVDWEFPGGWGNNPKLGNPKTDGQAYVDLMRELREMLDRVGKDQGKYLELTSAIGTAKHMVDVVDYADAQQYMDYIFAMSYDYHGAWENQVGHSAALYSTGDEVRPDLNVHERIQYILAAGVPKEKLVLGAPIYGRAWQGVHDFQPNQPFTGTAKGPAFGTWEPGAYDYDHLRLQYLGDDFQGKLNFEYVFDDEKKASYLWRERDGVLISFDSPQVIEAKAEYVIEHDLAGIFTWEIDADNGDILNAIHRGLGSAAK